MADVYRDDAVAVDTLKRMLDGKAMRPPQLGNKRSISAKLSNAAIIGLKQKAKELGYMHDGTGNLSMLLEAIGCGILEVSQPELKARSL